MIKIKTYLDHLSKKEEKTKRPSFVGLRNYSKSNGERSSLVLLTDFNYKNLLKSDLNTLQENKDYVINLLSKIYSKHEIETSLEKIESSLIKRISNDNLSPYEYLSTGIKQHTNTGELYISGLVINKTIHEKGEYPKTNKRKSTLLKEQIEKILGFKQNKFRNYKLENVEEIRINKQEIRS